jgi:hypothetical protein
MKISKVTRLSLTSKLKQHPLYKSAKNGSMSDAQILVSDIVPDSTVFSRLRGFVCPVRKASGNKIPYALADYLEQHSNLILWPYVELDMRNMVHPWPKEFFINHPTQDRSCLVTISWLMMFLLQEKH